jgi:hypothetical protein
MGNSKGSFNNSKNTSQHPSHVAPKSLYKMFTSSSQRTLILNSNQSHQGSTQMSNASKTSILGNQAQKILKTSK